MTKEILNSIEETVITLTNNRYEDTSSHEAKQFFYDTKNKLENSITESINKIK